jgi:uncharacterized protein (DUF58 family)
MIPKELLQKVRRIEIKTSRLVSDIFAGQYHSVFKGQDIEFEEIREYQPGDDIRTIDWNVTARTGTAHVKKFVEERELTVMILVDLSASLQFATVHELKSQLAAEISATIAISAIRNNDKVGLIIFTDGIEKFIPPHKGSKHVLRIIREVLYFKPKGKGTDISAAVEYLNRVTTRRTISFIVSDFFEKDDAALKKTLSVANKKHDLIAVTLNDPKELELPNCGLLMTEDAETGRVGLIDSGDLNVRDQYNKANKKRLELREKLFKSIGLDYINVSTDSSYIDAIVKFFAKRKRR